MTRLTFSILPSQSNSRSLSTEEENYFNAEEDDDDEPAASVEVMHAEEPMDQVGSKLRRTESTSTLLRSNAVGDEYKGSPRRKRQKLDSITVKSTEVDDTGLQTNERPNPNVEDSFAVRLAEPTTDPEQELERIREKRKRAEHEEEEENVLVKKKTGSSHIIGGLNKKGPLGSSAPGKLKLLFGANKTP